MPVLVEVYSRPCSLPLSVCKIHGLTSDCVAPMFTINKTSTVILYEPIRQQTIWVLTIWFVRSRALTIFNITRSRCIKRCADRVVELLRNIDRAEHRHKHQAFLYNTNFDNGQFIKDRDLHFWSGCMGLVIAECIPSLFSPRPGYLAYRPLNTAKI